ncbi:MAG: replication-relaxation family protein [Planctomycetales bacterium]|nr:replication-relaxation family protein [Planctomycetales bacterium]
MAKLSRVTLTPRDLEILTLLDHVPMTPRQIQHASGSFGVSFPNEELVRRRLGRLRDSGLVRGFAYALPSAGRAPQYWKLTSRGYRQLYGASVAMPSPRYFREIALGMHTHTSALADVVAHLMHCGARHDVQIDQFVRENAFTIEIGGFTLRPDAAFRLRRPAASERPYSFLVELDNGTERVRSTKDIESIERKIRGYDLHQARYHRDDPARYLVLFVTTRSEQRLESILGACDHLIRNPDRTLFLGATLDQLLASDPFVESVLLSNNGMNRTLIPRVPKPATNTSAFGHPLSLYGQAA